MEEAVKKAKPGEELSHLTDGGIPGIDKVPYGIHLCHFYRDRQELAGALLPYFEAGIRNNERCFWVAADPLPAEEARREFVRRYPALEDALKGQLTILDHGDWYSGRSGGSVLESWVQEEQAALAGGYRGFRLTGNTSFLTVAAWQAFMEYEQRVTEAVGASRIIALCSYTTACTMAAAADVMCAHQFTLERERELWQLREPLPSTDD
jgi:hypothetical protein